MYLHPIAFIMSGAAALGTMLATRKVFQYTDMEPRPSETIREYGSGPRFYSDPSQPLITSDHTYNHTAVEAVKRLIV